MTATEGETDLSDPIPDAHLKSLAVRRETKLLFEGLASILDAPVARDETAIMAALCLAFVAAADYCDVDPEAAFSQIVEALDRGEMSCHDDPAQGRWVFPETTISH
jgi:hypothetical protein